MIFRIQINEIKVLIEHFPAVGIVGPRQVGKTTLVRDIISDQFENTLYLDLESPTDYNRIAENPEWFLDQHKGKTVIIDEVQQMLSLFPILRSAIDKDRKSGRFILLGSASPEFLAKSSETLAGRIAFIELNTINIQEFPQQSILWFRGGFPDALLASNDQIWQKWQLNYIKTYMERDLSNLGISASPLKINQMLYMLAGIHGNLLNISSLSNALRLDQRTLAHYLDVLEHAFLTRRLQPWYINIQKRLIKSPKIYLRDSGNLHYLLNIPSQDKLPLHASVGHSWEGFVIEQISALLKENVKPYFYRTSHGAEVDLVLVQGITPVASIEIKLSLNSRIGKGNTIAIQDLNTRHNFVITPEGGDFMIKEDWRVCSISELLVYLNDLELLEAPIRE